MSLTLRSLASLFLLVATVAPNAMAAPIPPDAPPDEELPFGALARIGSAKFPFRHRDKKNDPTLLQIAFSPDGKWLAALGYDDVLLLLDAKTGMLVRQIDATSKSGDSARSLAFAPDSGVIATNNGLIFSLPKAVPKAEQVAVFNPKMGNPELVVFSPDGKKLAIAAHDSIALFDATKGTNILRKDLNFKSVNALAFAPDGKSLVIAGERDTTKPKEKIQYPIAIYDTEKLAWITTLDAGVVRSMSFIGKKLVTSHDNGNVRIWDVDKGTVASTYKGHPGDVPLAAWDTDTKTMLTAGLDGTVRLWKSDEKEDRRIRIAEPGNVQLFAVSPDGKTLAAGRASGLIQLWDLKSESMKAIIGGHQAGISSLAFSPDGKTLVTGSIDRTARLWDAATGKGQLKLLDHADTVAALAFTPDGKDLVTAAEKVRVWNVSDAVETRRFGKDKVPAHPLALSPDGKLLAEAIVDHGLTLWDPGAGKERHRFEEKTLGKPGGLCVAFSRDGRWIATGTEMPERGIRWTEGLIALWDADKRKLVRQFGGHPVKVAGGVKAIAFTADSNSVLYAEDKTLWLCDIATGNEVRRFDGHDEPIICLALSPDGRILASADKDKALRLWEVRTGVEIRKLTGHKEPVLSLAFSPDGKRLAAGSADGTALIWQVYAPLDAKTPYRPEFTPKELEGVWSDLTRRDSMNAHLAVAALAGAPKDSVPFLKDRLNDYQSPDPKQLAKLTAAVLDELPPECDDAYRDLQDLEEAAADAVRDALKKSPSDSARKRLQKLLDDRDEAVHFIPAARRLAILRSLAVLELIADADCIAILNQLAKGNPKDPIVREATATLDRLSR